MPELKIVNVDLSWVLVDGQPFLGDMAVGHGRLADGTPVTREVLVKGDDYRALYIWLNRVGKRIAGESLSNPYQTDQLAKG